VKVAELTPVGGVQVVVPAPEQVMVSTPDATTGAPQVVLAPALPAPKGIAPGIKLIAPSTGALAKAAEEITIASDRDLRLRGNLKVMMVMYVLSRLPAPPTGYRTTCSFLALHNIATGALHGFQRLNRQ
jgi:hypothetical protein